MVRLELSDNDILGIRAGNPGPFTLSGTNSWIVGREPAWLVDPGPNLARHVEAIADEVTSRGGLGGIALTHDHRDHTEAVPVLRDRFPGVPVSAARGDVDAILKEGEHFGPLEVIGTPGHSPDHVALVVGDAALTGDAVLGEGSVFISPDPGALAGYLTGLRKLRDRHLAILCPGHGPLVEDAAAKLDEYIAHRLERERKLVDALAKGKRTVDELLDEAWSDVPAALRPAAAVTLAAHLDKLEEEGRLPGGVQRPRRWLS